MFSVREQLSKRFEDRLPPQEFKKPHPLAYAHFAAKKIEDIKVFLKLSCMRIKQLDGEFDDYEKELYSKSTRPRRRKRLLVLLDTVNKEEKKERKGFQILRHLLQLERVLVQSYRVWTERENLASTRKQYTDKFWYEYEEARGNDMFILQSMDNKVREIFDEEASRLSDKYKEFLAEHDAISTKIKTYMAGSPDDWTFDYTLENYCPCKKCFKIFNRKTLLPFGEIVKDECGAPVKYCCRDCSGSGEGSSGAGATRTLAPYECLGPDSLPPQAFSNPHPLAYAWYASRVELAQNEIMESSRLRIERVKLRRGKASMETFSTCTTGFDFVDILDKEEEKERNGLELMRCLQQLERNIVKCYWMRTMKERTDLLLKDFVTNGVEDTWKNKGDDSAEGAYLKVLHKEYTRCMNMFNQNFSEHDEISKESTTYLSGLRPSCKSTNESMMRYALVKYLPCAQCFRFYNRTVAKLFGVVEVDDKTGGIVDFRCFDCAPHRKDASDHATAIPTTPTEVDSSQKVEQTVTSAKKRRKRKKKKKKKSVDSSVSASCPSDADGSELPSCSTHTSELKTPLEKGKSGGLTVEINESKERGNIAYVSDSSCFDTGTPTTVTSFSSSATPESLDNNIQNEEEGDKASSITDSLNEQFVEYLWKTGSVIALDKFMDDMDEVYANTSHP